MEHTKEEILEFYETSLAELSEVGPDDFETAKVYFKKKTGKLKEFNLFFTEHSILYLVSVIKPFMEVKINMLKEEIKKRNKMKEQNRFEDKLKEILAKEGLAVSPGLLTCYTADLMEIAETQLEVNYTKLRKMEIKAYDIAAEAFRNKTDKDGVCHFAHLNHVCEQVHKEMERNVVDANSTLGLFYQKCCIVALLHDLLEDAGWTAKMLLEKGFDKEIVNAVVSLTRRDDEKHYFDFIERVAKNDIAKKVKIYDLEHYMDAARLSKLDDTDLDRIKKYWWCREYLLGNVSSVECNNNIHPDRLFR